MSALPTTAKFFPSDDALNALLRPGQFALCKFVGFGVWLVSTHNRMGEADEAKKALERKRVKGLHLCAKACCASVARRNVRRRSGK